MSPQLNLASEKLINLTSLILEYITDYFFIKLLTKHSLNHHGIYIFNFFLYTV